MTGLDLSWAVKRVDAALRARQGIEEYTDDPLCVLRISLGKAGRALTLSDGARIAPDDEVVQIHFWNEQLPLIPRTGPNAAWAATLGGRVRHSLSLFVARMQVDRRFDAMTALWTDPPAADGVGQMQMSRIGRHLGFDVFDHEESALQAFFQGLLVSALLRTFNPGAKRARLAYRRCEIWISRAKLMSRYAH